MISLKIHSKELYGCKSISELNNLREFVFNSFTKEVLDTSNLINLEICYLEWNKKIKGISNLINLKKLSINKFIIRDNSFTNFIHLEELKLFSCNLTDLQQITALEKLSFLELSNCRKLEDLDGIENLTKLSFLEINTCKKIYNLRSIFKLKNLISLSIINLGEIDSLLGISKLINLEELYFFQSTEISDGNLLEIKNLDKLKKISFANRRNYNLKIEDFE